MLFKSHEVIGTCDKGCGVGVASALNRSQIPTRASNRNRLSEVAKTLRTSRDFKSAQQIKRRRRCRGRVTDKPRAVLFVKMTKKDEDERYSKRVGREAMAADPRQGQWANSRKPVEKVASQPIDWRAMLWTLVRWCGGMAGVTVESSPEQRVPLMHASVVYW